MFNALKEILRSIPPLYNLYKALYGFAKYVIFQLKISIIKFQEKKNDKKHIGLPLPPPMLRYRAHGALDKKSFLHVGQVCAQNLRDLIKIEGKDLYLFDNILDFGCGCGRILRYFNDHPDSCNFHGTDIDEEAIAWCKAHLARVAHWDINNYIPPTSYADSTFGLIWAISVFSHLDEQLQFAWLEELKRISKPGCILVLSIHGAYTTNSLTTDDRSVLNSNGFLYKRCEIDFSKLGGFPDFYQLSFHTKDYIHREWSKFFKIIRYVERGIATYHDAVILCNK